MDPGRSSVLISLRRLPRAGGDGPCICVAAFHVSRAPPRRRGWTPASSSSGRAARGSPAQAGMDPHRPPLTHPCQRLPRAGGDGPTAGEPRVEGPTAPPRRRGWTLHPVSPAGRGEGSPAQAGMDPTHPCERVGVSRLPRAGGDGPHGEEGAHHHCEAPPRRRGWTPPRASARWAASGSPAQAGMDPREEFRDARGARLPRAGGDGPALGDRIEWILEAPPRRRGWTHPQHRRRSRPQGSPAQAGMDPCT